MPPQSPESGFYQTWTIKPLWLLLATVLLVAGGIRQSYGQNPGISWLQQGDVLVGEARSDFTRADTLRGSLRPERTSWDVQHYNLFFHFNFFDSTYRGIVYLTAEIVQPLPDSIQIDLQQPLKMTKVAKPRSRLAYRYRRANNVVWVYTDKLEKKAVGDTLLLELRFEGPMRIAPNPPWDGGFAISTDRKGRLWFGLSCEGLGASAWWPCKDHLYDEPDSGASITAVLDQYEEYPEEWRSKFEFVANGVPQNALVGEGEYRHTWNVQNPINNYNISITGGCFRHFSDTLNGMQGQLPLDYYVLDYNLEKAQEHFRQVKPMLHCFEKTMGPYAFYEDGYALVETPYWGMEHQGAIAYGNDYKNHRFGFDFIIIHESGHEWWGNNISTRDHAELWIHESFTTYSEFLYLECTQSYNTAVDYLMGQRRRIADKDAVMGPLGVNFTDFASADMYYKGAWMLHAIRRTLADDERFLEAWRAARDTFYQKQISSRELISFLVNYWGEESLPIFRQYLTYIQPPVLEYYIGPNEDGHGLFYRWKAGFEDFRMPIFVRERPDELHRLATTTTWQYRTIPHSWVAESGDLKIDPTSAYFNTQKVPEPPPR